MARADWRGREARTARWRGFTGHGYLALLVHYLGAAGTRFHPGLINPLLPAGRPVPRPTSRTPPWGSHPAGRGESGMTRTRCLTPGRDSEALRSASSAWIGS